MPFHVRQRRPHVSSRSTIGADAIAEDTIYRKLELLCPATCARTGHTFHIVTLSENGTPLSIDLSKIFADAPRSGCFTFQHPVILDRNHLPCPALRLRCDHSVITRNQSPHLRGWICEHVLKCVRHPSDDPRPIGTTDVLEHPARSSNGSWNTTFNCILAQLQFERIRPSIRRFSSVDSLVNV